MNNLHTFSLRHFFIKRALFSSLIAWLLLSGITCLAQPQRGTYPSGSYAISNIESINPVNGNLMFNLPLGALPAGRKGMGAGVGLHYNSKLFDSFVGEACYYDESTYQYVCESVEQLVSSPEGGWRLGFQYKLQQKWNPNFACDGAYKMVMSFPDGSTHEFMPYGYSVPNNGGYYSISADGYGFDSACHWALINSGTMTYFSTDGTYLKLEVQHDTNDGWENNPWTLSLPDGGKVKFNEPGANGLRIYDSNQNFIEVQKLIVNNLPVDKVVDQFNRSITIEYGTSTGTQVKVPGANGQTLTWTITGVSILTGGYWDLFAYFSNGSNGGYYELYLPGITGINQIIPPAQSGGYAYTFDYNYPSAGQGFGEVKSVTLPSADQNKAKVNYTYANGGYGQHIWNILENKVTQKTQKYLNQYDNPTTFDNPANYITDTWTYAYPDPWTGGVSTITSPDGSVVTEWSYGKLSDWKTGIVYKSERPDGTVIERISQPNTPQSPNLVGDFNVYTKTEFASIKDASGTLVKTVITDYNYDKNGNLTQRADYDYVDYADVPRDASGKPIAIPYGAVPAKVIVNTYSNPTPDASNKTTPTTNAYNRPGSPDRRISVASNEIRSGFSPNTALTRTEFTYDDALTTGNATVVKAWDSVKQSTVPTSLTAANSSCVLTDFDPYGNVTMVTDARNVQTKFDYDPVLAGNSSTANLYPTKIRKAYGTPIQLSSSLTYEFQTGLTLTTTDDDNQTTDKTSYDDLGRPVLLQEAYSSASNTAQRETASQYFDASRTVISRADLATVRDGKMVSILHHDQLGRVRLARTLENSVTQGATDETVGVKVQTRYATTSTNTYKVISNPYRAANSTAASSEYTMGWVRETVDRSGRAVESQTFDGSGLPAPWGANTNSMGISTVAYDANYTTTTDPAGKIKRTRVNGLGQLDRTDEPDSSNSLGTIASPVQSTSYTYDALSRMTLVTQGVQTRSFVYSSLSRLISQTNPEKAGADTFEYDDGGNITKHTDARGWFTTSTYDALGRVTTVDYSNTTVNPDIKKFYDNPAAEKYGKGRYWYDYTGGDETTGQTVEYSAVDGYDILGRPLSATQKFKTSGTWSNPFTTSHLYDLSGNVKEKTLPSLHKITYSFDAIGRLSQMVGNLDGVQRTYSTGITYNASGNMIREQFGTQTPLYHNRHYNNLGQLYDVRLGTNGGDEWSWNRGALRIFYGANSAVGNGGTLNNGNVYREDHFIPLNDAVTSWFMPVEYYGYDELNRVTGLWEQTYTSTGANNYSTLNQTYTYDRYGNRTVSGSSNVPVSPAFKFVAASNRQKASTDTDTDAATDKMRYDAVGNLTKDKLTQTTSSGAKTYDINNQMLTAVSPNGTLNSYSYDAAGHRVRRSINNGTSNWWQVYGIGGELVAEYAAGSATNLPNKEYGYRLGELLVVGDVGAGCVTRWMVTDQVNTPRILADSTGSLAGISRHDYLPFGEELTAGYGGRTTAQGFTGDCVRDKFANYERDVETGLDFAEARYHGSVYGRFTSVDPAMGSAHLSMPQSWNRYSYVMNSPLSLTDPTGEYWVGKNVANGSLWYHVKGSPAKASDAPKHERERFESEGWTLYDDNTLIQFSAVGGTGEEKQLRNTIVRLGSDGIKHVVRPLGKGDRIALGLLGAYGISAVLAVGTVEITGITIVEMALIQAQIYGLGTGATSPPLGGAVLHTEEERPDLKPIHALDPKKLESIRQMSTEDIIRSLAPGQDESLRTRPDGNILQGHHRIEILKERGVNVNNLPREVIPKITFKEPKVRPRGR